MVYRLVILWIALVVIGIAAIMFYFGTYLAAPEDKRRLKAGNIRLYGLILVTVGSVYLIYSMPVLRG